VPQSPLLRLQLLWLQLLQLQLLRLQLLRLQLLWLQLLRLQLLRLHQDQDLVICRQLPRRKAWNSYLCTRAAKAPVVALVLTHF
jgi:hypothetical protein